MGRTTPGEGQPEWDGGVEGASAAALPFLLAVEGRTLEAEALDAVIASVNRREARRDGTAAAAIRAAVDALRDGRPLPLEDLNNVVNTLKLAHDAAMVPIRRIRDVDDGREQGEGTTRWETPWERRERAAVVAVLPSGLLGIDGREISRRSKEGQHIITDLRIAQLSVLRHFAARPEELHALDPRVFEEFVAELLTKQGYTVTLTPAAKDGGCDLIAVRQEGLGRFCTLVECKRYGPHRRISVELVRALHGVVDDRRASAGALVTTSAFTKAARVFAQGHAYRMGLHDFDALRGWIGAALATG